MEKDKLSKATDPTWNEWSAQLDSLCKIAAREAKMEMIASLLEWIEKEKGRL